ncbi:MAG: bifunctional pyr operon transcriptional regulator/uracil phosphoribosyltransferase PyrR [Clostridiales bacterium]|nr:bifunctional pyr operon transcriptional regulator/uracil phosphoribosyltransferase PyrR [Clostridiales bacterium]
MLETILLDEMAVERALKRISHEIIERNKGVDNLVLIGVRTRGVPMAEKIRSNINLLENADIPFGKLDIKMYRDDLTEVSEMPIVSDTNIPFSVQGKDVILCDDVLFTGRTVRAAIEAIMSLGRPKSIQLAVLIDRGHRELPIRADYVGKNIPTSLNEVVSVKFMDVDGVQNVALNKK